MDSVVYLKERGFGMKKMQLMKRLKRVALVVFATLVVQLAMYHPLVSSAGQYDWGYEESGAPQHFDYSYRVTGFVLKKVYNGIVNVKWITGTYSGTLRVRVFGSESLSSSSGENLTKTADGVLTSYRSMSQKNTMYGFENGVPENYYCYLQMSTSLLLPPGTAQGIWDPN